MHKARGQLVVVQFWQHQKLNERFSQEVSYPNEDEYTFAS
jgi:hypothetical protein